MARSRDACLAVFDLDGTGERASAAAVLRRLEQQGFSAADDRIAREWATIAAAAASVGSGGGAAGTGGTIALEQLALLKDDNMLIDAALRGTLVVPAFDAFCAALVEIFAETYPNKGGACADYIPQLAVVNPDQDHDAEVGIVPAVDEQGLERCCHPACARCRQMRDDGL